MTVVVTGAAGLLGSHVLVALGEAGIDARGVDAVASPQAGPAFVRADLRDFGQAVQALAGADAVVHAAAIPRPIGRTAAEVFATNVLTAQSVVDAALLHGVRRIVNASSFSVLGWPFNPQPLMPAYLPIDEDHPLAPQEAYGLSKLLTEEILDAAVRREPELSVLSLRMPWIQSAATFATDVVPRRADAATSTGNLWSYIDAQDAAAAFLRGLTVAIDGHRKVYIAAADTFMEQKTAALVAAAFPGVELKGPLAGHDGVIDCSAATALLGITPRCSWRDYPERAQ